ncbi:MAG: hypothetical protein RLO52_45200 [Sandaracinaceae bacterium]|nr:MAG: hypothetical protein EVA89_22960 [Sandaracinaceae bacterium]HBQ17203.1 hypothetical protein [Myxococcales bacterium]
MYAGALLYGASLFGFVLTPPGGAPPPQLSPTPQLVLDLEGLEEPESSDEADLAEAIAERRQMADIHRAFGIATWASMAVTAVLGFLQLYDEYGLWEDAANTPCARNDAILGFCGDEVPWPHAIAAGTTAALYTTTFILSFTMPDPLDQASANTPESERLRIHKTLRWFHLAGVVVLAALGGITANIDADYEVRRGLAWAHFGTAVATFGTLTAAGALMVF